MSPTPTDVSYHRNASLMEPRMAEGVPAKEQSHAADERGGASRGNASSALTVPAAAQPSQGGGPGNMPSGISVQELKQMTALRMAHAQGHLQVVSPFQHGSNGGAGRSSRGSSSARDNLLSSNNDINNPPPPAANTQKKSSPAGPGERGEASLSGGPRAPLSKTFFRTNSTRGHGNADGQRSRRHAPPPTALKSDFSSSNDAGRAEEKGAGGVVEVPPAPGSSGDESSGRVGGARRGRSPLPKGRGLSLPPPPPPTSGNSSLRASPSTSSSMPHGLTVQELKELTKRRLAKEASNMPVYSVLQADSQQQDGSTRPSSPGGGNRDSKAPGGRGRPMSPFRRRQDSRSPVGGTRSNLSSPNPDGSDRPHRRTRRGGRRGRNRSPRPDDQYSPSLSGRAGGSSGAGGSTAGAESRDGHSSASPSPSGRRGLGDTWSEPDEHGLLRQRSSSPPRPSTSRRGADHGHPLEYNQRPVVANGGARSGATSGHGRGNERGDHNKRSSEQRRPRRDRPAGGERGGGGGLYAASASPGRGPQLDMMHGVGGVSAIGGGHSQSHNHNSGSNGRNGGAGGRMPDAFSVHCPGGPSTRSGRSSSAPGSREPHWDAAANGAGRDGNRGRAALHRTDAAWIESDRRRGEVRGDGSQDVGGEHNGRGGGGHHHEPMMPPAERFRPAHVDRGFGRTGGSGFDQANHRERDNGRRTHHVAGFQRGERAVLRGGGSYDPRGDTPPPPGHHARMHRSSSEVLSSSAGSRSGRPMSVANVHGYPPSSNHHHGISASPHLRPRQHSAPYPHARGSSHPAAGFKHGHLNGNGGGGGRGGGSHSLTTGSDSGSVGRGGGGGFDHDFYFQASHHNHHGHHAPTLQRGVSAPIMSDPHAPGPLRQEQLESLDRSTPGRWNGSSLPPHLPLMGGRNGQRSRTGSSDGGMGGSVGSGGGGGRVGGGYSPGLSLGERMGKRRVSSSSLTRDGVRDDISHMVAESVLVTPKNGGPAHWKTHPASLNYPAQAGHQYHGARRNLGDDHSSSSTDSYPLLQHDNSTSSRSAGGGMRAGPHLDQHHPTFHQPLLKQPSHQQMTCHDDRIDRNAHGESSGPGFHGHFPCKSSVPNFGVAVGGGVHREDQIYEDNGVSVDTDGGAAGSRSFLSSLGGPSTIGGAGDEGGSENDGIAIQSPLLQGAGYPGSGPAGAFQRESFAPAQGDRTVVGGGKGASSGIESDRFNSAGRGSVESLTSPTLGGNSPTVGGQAEDSLSAVGTGGASTNANSSPLMTSLTFSLELAGYTTTGGAHSFRLGGSNMSDGAGSAHGSDSLGFDTAASDSGIETSRGGLGVAGGGSWRFGGGTDGLGSSPASMHGSFGGRETFSLPRHLEIGPSSFTNDFVGSAPGTSSLFSFNNHDHNRGGDGAGGAFDDLGKDEMADRPSLSGGLGEGQSPPLVGLQRGRQKTLYGSGQLTRSGFGPVRAIGSSRSNSSVTSSPRDANTGLPTPPMSTSRSPVVFGVVGNATEVDGEEIVTVMNGEGATDVGGGIEPLNVY